MASKINPAIPETMYVEIPSGVYQSWKSMLGIGTNLLLSAKYTMIGDINAFSQKGIIKIGLKATALYTIGSLILNKDGTRVVFPTAFRRADFAKSSNNH